MMKKKVKKVVFFYVQYHHNCGIIIYGNYQK